LATAQRKRPNRAWLLRPVCPSPPRCALQCPLTSYDPSLRGGGSINAAAIHPPPK
jgi:hypothetical protein